MDKTNEGGGHVQISCYQRKTSYVGPINKNKITKEYYYQIKKIWNLELSLFNKVIAHNAVAVPTFITLVGIDDWTINEMKMTAKQENN